MNKNDYTNNALHYYDHRNIVTNSDGELEITTTAEDTEVIGFDEVKQEKVHLTKHFKSGMLQSWNKFCFTGGIIEAEVVLPGKWNVGGLWPAFWILGNLSRHTYLGSSSNVWPWSLLECTNEEMINSQALSACLGATHWGMEKGVGRGAPEVDIFEVQPGPVKGNTGMFKKTWIGEPFMSASYQVAPGKSWDRPGPGFWPGPDQWYRGIQTGPNTTINIMFYGNWNSFGTKSRKHTSRRRLKANSQSPSHNYWSDALSYNHQLNSDHFETRHKYRLEWGLPSDDKDATGLDSGYLNWYLDDEFVLSIRADNIKTFTSKLVSFVYCVCCCAYILFVEGLFVCFCQVIIYWKWITCSWFARAVCLLLHFNFFHQQMQRSRLSHPPLFSTLPFLLIGVSMCLYFGG